MLVFGYMSLICTNDIVLKIFPVSYFSHSVPYFLAFSVLLLVELIYCFFFLGGRRSGLFFFFFLIFIYLFTCFQLYQVFVTAYQLFSSCGEQGLLFIAVHGLLTEVASLVAEHRL